MPMGRMIGSRIALAFVASTTVWANEHAEPSTDSAEDSARWTIQRLFPELTAIEELVLGDIDGDGIADAAAIVLHPQEPVEGETILVLKGHLDKSYMSMARSLTYSPRLRGLEYLSIENGSFYITNSDIGYTAYTGVRFQFRLQHNKLTLVGLESSSGEIGNEPSQQLSVNFLTKEIIEFQNTTDKRTTIHRRLKNAEKIVFERFEPHQEIDLSSAP